MAEAHSLDQPLHVLPAMLNMVLIQTGKVLRDPDLRSPQHTDLARRRLTEFVPLANTRFQEALDEIEIQILQAKAVMERDLSKIRKKRAARERLSHQAVKADSSKEAQPNVTRDMDTIGDTAVPHNAQGDQQEDTVMANANTAQKGDGAPAEDERNAVNAVKNAKPTASLDGMPQDSQNTNGLAISMPKGAEANAEDAKTALNDQAAGVLDPIGGPTAVGNQQVDQANAADDFDIDSFFKDDAMFKDAEMIPNDTGDINFDLDFSAGDADLHTALGDSTMGGMDLGTTGVAGNGAGTGEDLNSLLPGLDDFVNASGEPSINQGNNNITSGPAVNQQASNANTVGSVPPAPNTSLVDSTFEDFFNADDFDGSGQNNENQFSLEADFDGSFGSFEDSWLDQ